MFSLEQSLGAVALSRPAGTPMDASQARQWLTAYGVALAYLYNLIMVALLWTKPLGYVS